MNQKLSDEDRKEIQGMLFDGYSHAEIAEHFNVCTRTIDREAEYWRDHTITIRAVGTLMGPPIVAVRVGKDVHGVDLDELKAEGLRMARELEDMPVPSFEDLLPSDDDLAAIDRMLEAWRQDMPKLNMELEALAAQDMPEIVMDDMPDIDRMLDELMQSDFMGMSCGDDDMM